MHDKFAEKKKPATPASKPFKKKTRAPQPLYADTKVDFFAKTMQALDGPTESRNTPAPGGRYRNKPWATSSATFRP